MDNPSEVDTDFSEGHLSMAALTVERLRAALGYDPETGEFIRLSTSTFNPKVQEGKLAGSHYSNGYLGIRIGKQRYLAHRLAWFYVHGHWPKTEIDHINGVKDDNRIGNLREATRSLNMANARRQRNNTSGVKGVSFDKATGKWMAYISVAGKIKNLGRYESIEMAAAIRQSESRKVFGDYARL